ncbi:hypothetical protein ABFS82_03G104500 [Erythranthe guttata]|uniref:Uncharacterized protein n=1 Tax=Erythranthe guttata TaxID=4155 RepID=A0A022Q2M6_ERYGU|nr:PREDICTED: uncharacterized protein LOC105974438 [Erythranthe guttata]EYU22907.1 hypothetical protein MIMGU_mgv1a009753mg [Erythranthe guttata]|eukprot:XP_012854993.1 PREDICTED: uncharacterized protein LOC105974438 [Erythranthe guttata]
MLMAKSKKPERKSDSHHHGISLRKLSSRCMKSCKDAHHDKKIVEAASEKKEWEDALCSVCMEFPHNAVLLLCSSYEKGCRPYMCATSRKYSNCLVQYRKAYTNNVVSKNENFDSSNESNWAEGKDTEASSQLLPCPLCRGPVKGWTVVEPARRYLNAKKRACTQDNCSFVGKYKNLKKHVKLEHPFARPREVDPTHVEKWKKLENERDLSDVYSTIRSTMPGAIVVGDYVIDRSYRGVARGYDDYFLDDDEDDDVIGYGGRDRWNGRIFGRGGFGVDYDSFDDNEGDFARLRARTGVASRRLGNIPSSQGGGSRPRARLLVARRAARLRGGR